MPLESVNKNVRVYFEPAQKSDDTPKWMVLPEIPTIDELLQGLMITPEHHGLEPNNSTRDKSPAPGWESSWAEPVSPPKTGGWDQDERAWDQKETSWNQKETPWREEEASWDKKVTSQGKEDTSWGEEDTSWGQDENSQQPTKAQNSWEDAIFEQEEDRVEDKDTWSTADENPWGSNGLRNGDNGDDSDETSFTSATMNHTEGPWPSKDSYLRSHYKFLREDALRPLKESVGTFLSAPEMMEDRSRPSMGIYEQVDRPHCHPVLSFCYG